MLGRKNIFTNDEFVVRSKIQTGWGLPIALYFFFSGTGAGLFLCSLILHSSLGVLVDLVFLGVGVMVLFSDLGNPWRFWKAFKKPCTSWISRGTFLITILFLFDLIYSLIGFPILPLPITLFFGAIAVLVILYPGLVISYSPSIASWNSGFIPILFGFHSLTSGLLIYLVLLPAHENTSKKLIFLVLALLLSLLISTVIFLLVSHTSTIGSKGSVQLLLRGRWGVSFLLLSIMIGIIIPLGLVSILTGSFSFGSILLFACILRLAGDFGFRYMILKVGQYDSLI